MLAPAIRACDADCGDLDERTGECETTIEIPAVSPVRVRYVATQPCETTP